jgi:hypothetical protein
MKQGIATIIVQGGGYMEDAVRDVNEKLQVVPMNTIAVHEILNF